MRMRRDWTRAGLATLTAFSLTITGYWLLGATPKDAQPPTAVINEPTLSLDGCTVKVRIATDTPELKQIAATGTIQLGLLPRFTLQVFNPGSAVATIHFVAHLRISTVAADLHPRSAPPPPAPIWSKEFTLTLKPGQTLFEPIDTGAKIQSMDMAQMSLENGDQQIIAVELSTPAAQAAQRQRNDVVFADTHVEFDANPYVGQSGDNIWTTTQPAASPAQPAAKQVVAKTDP